VVPVQVMHFRLLVTLFAAAQMPACRSPQSHPVHERGGYLQRGNLPSSIDALHSIAFGVGATWDPWRSSLTLHDVTNDSTIGVIIDTRAPGPPVTGIDAISWHGERLWAFDGNSRQLIEAGPPLWKATIRRVELPTASTLQQHFRQHVQDTRVVGIFGEYLVATSWLRPIVVQSNQHNLAQWVEFAVFLWRADENSLRMLPVLQAESCLRTSRTSQGRHTRRLPYCYQPAVATNDSADLVGVIVPRRDGERSLSLDISLYTGSTSSRTFGCQRSVELPDIPPQQRRRVVQAISESDSYANGDPTLEVPRTFGTWLGSTITNDGSLITGVQVTDSAAVYVICSRAYPDSGRTFVSIPVRLVDLRGRAFLGLSFATESDTAVAVYEVLPPGSH
jgi:hypothetical protein